MRLAAARTRYPTVPPWTRTPSLFRSPACLPIAPWWPRANWRPIRRRNRRPRGCRTCGRRCAATIRAPHAAAATACCGRLLRRKPADAEAPTGTPNGLYLVGEVGRGKSMLMDLFFAAAEVARKQRIHFHRFMQNVACARSCLEAGQSGRHRSDPAAGRRHRGRGGAAVLRRVPGQRHRRRDDPGPAVPGPVRARRGGGRDLQRRARTICSRASRAATRSCRSSR